jgi:hypothetical protein
MHVIRQNPSWSGTIWSIGLQLSNNSFKNEFPPIRSKWNFHQFGQNGISINSIKNEFPSIRSKWNFHQFDQNGISVNSIKNEFPSIRSKMHFHQFDQNGISINSIKNEFPSIRSKTSAPFALVYSSDSIRRFADLHKRPFHESQICRLKKCSKRKWS